MLFTSDLHSPVAVQIPLGLLGHFANPKLLAADLAVVLIEGGVELVDPTVRRRSAVESRHGIFRFSRAGEINEAVTLARGSNCCVAMDWQNSLADSLDVVPVEQMPHLFVDERLVRDVTQAPYIEPPAFFDWFGPVFASIVAGAAVEAVVGV